MRHETYLKIDTDFAEIAKGDVAAISLIRHTTLGTQSRAPLGCGWEDVLGTGNKDRHINSHVTSNNKYN